MFRLTLKCISVFPGKMSITEYSTIVPVSIITILLISQSSSTSNKLKYVWGDALDDPLALDPDGGSYPWDLAAKIAGKERNPRAFLQEGQQLLSPQETRQILLNAFQFQEPPQSSTHMPSDGTDSVSKSYRKGRTEGKPEAGSTVQGCVPSRLCASTYNTTAPLYGVSLTSGKPVTIVQKFPDLLQQVVFQVCKTNECEVLQGECVQTYLPYLFLVIPLGPVTLTGQDYVLVESGCVCQPKYAQKYLPPPLPFIQPVP